MGSHDLAFTRWHTTENQNLYHEGGWFLSFCPWPAFFKEQHKLSASTPNPMRFCCNQKVGWEFLTAWSRDYFWVFSSFLLYSFWYLTLPGRCLVHNSHLVIHTISFASSSLKHPLNIDIPQLRALFLVFFWFMLYAHNSVKLSSADNLPSLFWPPQKQPVQNAPPCLSVCSPWIALPGQPCTLLPFL